MTKGDPEADKPVSVITDEDRRAMNIEAMTKTTDVLNPVEHNQMKKIAAEYWSSGALNDSFQNVEQVLMALGAGREMGMGFTESINGLYFVKGKLNIYGKATPSAIRRHGWRISYKNESQDSCTATLINVTTGEEITDTFTFEDAEQSGFTRDRNGLKIGWRPGANRKRKLRYAVLSQIIHTYIPEVLAGVAGIAEYTQDYMDSTNTFQTAAAAADAPGVDNKTSAAERIRIATEKAREFEDEDS